MEAAPFDFVPVPGAACHKGFEDADVDTLAGVFAESIELLEEHDVPYVVVGGLASAALGRPRASADIDILVMQQDARRALGAFADLQFATDEINPYWLFKAVKHGVLV